MSGSEITGLRQSHFTDTVIQEIIHGFDKTATLSKWEWVSLSTSNGILADASTGNNDTSTQRIVGLHAMRLTFSTPTKAEDIQTKVVVIKSKPRGQDVLQMLTDITGNLPGASKLHEEWKTHKTFIGLSNMDHRELQSYKLREPTFLAITPTVYWSFIDEPNDVFAFAMEHIDDAKFTHIDSVNEVHIWTEADISNAFEGISHFHARYYGKISDVPKNIAKYLECFDKKLMMNTSSLWKALLEHNHQNIPEIWDRNAYNILTKVLDNLGPIFEIIDASPKTFIHNDFNAKNVCLRKCDDNFGANQKMLCAYDWECAAIGCPQRDIAEFLLFVLPPDSSMETWRKYVTKYAECLETSLRLMNMGEHNNQRIAMDMQRFYQVFDMCVCDVMINRLNTYGPTHRHFGFSYLPRVILNGVNYLQAIKIYTHF